MHAGIKVTVWCVAAAVLGLVVLLAYHHTMSSALSTDCDNKVLQQVASPDDIYIATLFDRNCGATTPYYRVVSLRTRNTKFEPEVQSDWVFAVKHQPDVVLAWADAKHLSVKSDSSDESESPHASWRDVTILRESLR